MLGDRAVFYTMFTEFFVSLLEILAARRSGWQQDETGTVTIF